MGNQKGVALILTIGILTVLIIVATAFATRLHFEHLAARNYLNGLKARYLAEAGIERAIAELNHDKNSSAERILYQGIPSGVNPDKLTLSTPLPLPSWLVGHYLDPDVYNTSSPVLRIARLQVTPNPPNFDNVLTIREREDLTNWDIANVTTCAIFRRGQMQNINYFQARIDSLDESWATGLSLAGTGDVADQYSFTVTDMAVGTQLVGQLLNPDVDQGKTFTIIGVGGGRVIYTDPAEGPMAAGSGLRFEVYWAKDRRRMIYQGVSTRVERDWLRVKTSFPLGNRLVGHFLNPKLDQTRAPQLFRITKVLVDDNLADPTLFDNDIFVDVEGGDLTLIAGQRDPLAVIRREGGQEFDVRYARVTTCDRDTGQMNPPVHSQLDEVRDRGGNVSINGHVIRGIIDEDRKVNINLANKELLRNLTGTVLLEGQKKITDQQVDGIIDWRPGTFGEPGKPEENGIVGGSDDRPFKTIAEVMLAGRDTPSPQNNDDIGVYTFYGDDDGEGSGVKNDHILFIDPDNPDNDEDRGISFLLDGGIEDLITVSTAPLVFDISPDTGSDVNGFADGTDPIIGYLPGIYDGGTPLTDTDYEGGNYYAPTYYADVDFDGDGIFDFIDSEEDGSFDYVDVNDNGTWDPEIDVSLDTPMDINNYRYNTCPVNVNTAGETVLKAVIGGILGVSDDVRDRVVAAIISYRSGEPVGTTPDYTDGDENPFDGVDTNREDLNGDGIIEDEDIDDPDVGPINPLIPGFADDPSTPAPVNEGDGMDNDGDWRGWDGENWDDDENDPPVDSINYNGRPDYGENNVDEEDEAHLFAGGARGEFEALINFIVSNPYQGVDALKDIVGQPQAIADDIMDNANPDPDAYNNKCWTTPFKFSSDTFQIISTGRVLNPTTGKVRAKRTLERIVRR